MRPSVRRSLLAAASVALLPLSACDGTISDPSADVGAPVGVSIASEAVPPSFFAPAAPRVEDGALVITGSNGTLRISELDVRLAEVELERDDAECDGDDRPGCEDFGFEPRILPIPIDGSPVALGAGRLPEGLWEEIEVEVEGVDDDERSELQSGWGRGGSIRVAGRWIPSEGEPRDFESWIDAEFEAELEFEPPFRVEGRGADVILEFALAALLLEDDGRVLDLSAWDWDRTGRVLEIDDAERGLTVRVVTAPAG